VRPGADDRARVRFLPPRNMFLAIPLRTYSSDATARKVADRQSTGLLTVDKEGEKEWWVEMERKGEGWGKVGGRREVKGVDKVMLGEGEGG